MQTPIYVIIATSLNRTNMLLERSLLSVYKQENVISRFIHVLIVDDNKDECEFQKIEEGIQLLRTALGISDSAFPTQLIKNTRTPFHSGTGAWNTGIYKAYQEQTNCFISILDDDDEYLPNHLADCLDVVELNYNIQAVFQEIEWHFQDGKVLNFPLDNECMQAEKFYIGNPGIQGSNMFIHINLLVSVGAFDETFESSSDRDLMIRLLWHLKEKKQNEIKYTIAILNTIGVIHHVHSNDRISYNPIKKQNGLDRFYKKYKLYFSERAFQHSIKRATSLFQYQVSKPKRECIIILMALHNNETTVCNALNSILNQQATNRLLYVFVSDDNSTDESVQKVKLLSNQFQNIILFKNNFNSASKNREWLQSKVINEYPECVLIGRLDADDTLNEFNILQRIETLWDDTNFDVLIMANNQYLNEQFTGFINKPEDDLLNTEKLLDRLNKMAQGAWDAELPSCNVYVRPTIAIPYEELNSAEDHRNLVDYLLKGDELNIQIRSNWIYCDYRIDKHVNAKPEVKKIKAKVRNDLYQYTLNQSENKIRRFRALNILEKWKNGNYHYLGAGFSGVVFHDEQWVYKVHLPLSTNNFNEIDNILFLKEKLQLFVGRKHFYSLKELTFFEEAYILVYPYEKGEKVTSLSREDMLSFLSEMWAMKVLCRSITKENNFIRVNGVIKLIDYEIESYQDNLFLNTAARAFIQTDEFEHRDISYNKLKRSTINDFTLPELHGFDDFVCELFKRCHQYNFKPLIFPIKCTTKINDPILYDGINMPAVSLLIKACVQDSSTLYNDVIFLVSQLTKTISFLSRCLLLDIYKEDKFLRQYNQFGEVGELMDTAKRLKDEGIIDKIIIPPIEKQNIAEINLRWFDFLNNATHTQNGVPVTSQLYAFEEAPGDYILQMDVDVLIGIKEANFDYLKDMVLALLENENAVSIGFQIYHDEGIQKQKIIGLDANIPPDVRCCLLHKQRLISARPFINQSFNQGWQLSWYRALENHQKIKGIVSLRGGDTRAYYIHPPNYRKQNRWIWHTFKMGVTQGIIPNKQIGKVDIAGNIYDWCLPKRNEDFIVVLYINQRDTKQLQTSLQSIIGQDYSAFGLLLINNTGDCTFLEPFKDFISLLNCHTTIIDFEYTVPYNEAIYKAIHYYLNNQDSFICLLMQGDILLYTSVFSECINRLKIYDADLLIGKEVSKGNVVNVGIYRTNFIHPREDAESLCNGLAIFKKYLFDALSILDLKLPLQGKPNYTPTFSKIKENYEWLDDTSNICLLVPMIELSRNPIRFDHFNLLRSQPVSKYQLEEVIQYIKMKQPKVEGAWELGRKTFLPNINKIELDITYDCNLKCFHCNRSCTQAPTHESMTISQIQEFVFESISLKKQWQLINVLGGEPTLHPNFMEIIHCLLYEYLIPFSPNTILQITSNGHGEQVQKVLAKLPKHPNLIVNSNSFKEDRTIPYFTPFNLAPIDDIDSHLYEFHKGCWVTSYCGIGLNHLGYFACGVAGGIERIIKQEKVIKSLAELNEKLIEQLNTYCQFCGNFTAYADNRGDFMDRAEKESAPNTAMSESWKQFYKKYNHEQK